MLMRWAFRLAFPALGLLILLIAVGVREPEHESTGSSKGEPIPSFDGLIPDPLPEEGPEIVFKWRDRDGSWHFSDHPPASGPWDALAIDPRKLRLTPAEDQDADLHAPYHAPFSLAPLTGTDTNARTP